MGMYNGEKRMIVKRILEANVGGQRSRGRQRKRWIDVVKHNMEDLQAAQLNVEDAENRAEWRRRTRVADPYLRDPQPEGESYLLACLLSSPSQSPITLLLL